VGADVAPERRHDGRERARRLFLNRDFAALWTGQSASMLGSSVSFIGLPLVAVLIVHVSPFQLGLISAVERLPPLLVGPFVGSLVDSRSRYRLMMIADVGRAGILATIPVAVAFGGLRFWLLVVVAFVVGALTLLFNVAFQAFLPALVPPCRLGVGNARLAASQSASELTGPGLAAGLIALGGAAVAVAADAASYVFSAYCLTRISKRDLRRPAPGEAAAPSRLLPKFWHDTTVGFGSLRREQVLRIVTRSNAILVFFAQMQAAIYFLFLTKDLNFGANKIAVVFTAAGVIGLLGAFGCNRLVTRIGLGRLVIIGQLILALGGILLAAATGPAIVASAFIIAGEACFGVGLTLFGVGYQTLFQVRTADEVRGRVIGASRFITTASVPLAATLAGVLGATLGLRATLIAGAAGMTLGLAAILSPRIWQLEKSEQELTSR
jgi:MFS family permease